MPLPKTSGCKPLSHAVADSLEDYLSHLNGHLPQTLYHTVLDQVEPPLLRAALRYCDNNQSKAAQMLGLNRATLRKKLRHHNIDLSAEQ
ncbi:MAG: helix-turn-helix domain-containing protein [Panacagrimonas sp.]